VRDRCGRHGTATAAGQDTCTALTVVGQQGGERWGLVGHGDAALAQELLHVAVAQREAISKPDAMADHLAGEAAVRVACGISGWRHVGGLSGGGLGP